MDWFDLLPVQGTLKSLLQHHSSKAAILWHSAFFMPQLSHWYMTTGKSIALTRWTFVGKVMSLLFHMLVKVCHSFSSKEQASFNFMASVTIHIDFGVQENKVKVTQSCLTLCESMDCMEFSRQEHQSKLKCPPPGDLPNLGTEPVSACISCITEGLFTHWATW